MYIINFKVYTDCVIVELHNRNQLTLFFDSDSGKVVYRNKLERFLDIKHTGISIGYDTNGTKYVVHSHIETGEVCLDTQDNFAKGNPVFRYEKECVNSELMIIEKSFEAVLKRTKYRILLDNCQHLTGFVCNNKKDSPDLLRIGMSALGATTGVILMQSENIFLKVLGFVTTVGSAKLAMTSDFSMDSNLLLHQ